MKRLLLTVLIILTFCGVAFGATQLSAEEAFRIASEPSDDPLVGVWLAHPVYNHMQKFTTQNVAVVIIENSTGRFEEWAYVGILLEPGLRLKKGDVMWVFNAAEKPNLYEAKSVITSLATNYGTAFLLNDGQVLDMIRVTSQEYQHITHMTRLEGFEFKGEAR